MLVIGGRSQQSGQDLARSLLLPLLLWVAGRLVGGLCRRRSRSIGDGGGSLIAPTNVVPAAIAIRVGTSVCLFRVHGADEGNAVADDGNRGETMKSIPTVAY